MDVNPSNIDGSINVVKQDWGGAGIPSIDSSLFNKDIVCTLTADVTSLGVYLPANKVIGNGTLVVSMNLNYEASLDSKINDNKTAISSLQSTLSSAVSALQAEAEYDYTPYITWPANAEAGRRLSRIFDLLIIEGCTQQEIAEIDAFTATIAKYYDSLKP